MVTGWSCTAKAWVTGQARAPAAATPAQSRWWKCAENISFGPRRLFAPCPNRFKPFGSEKRLCSHKIDDGRGAGFLKARIRAWASGFLGFAVLAAPLSAGFAARNPAPSPSCRLDGKPLAPRVPRRQNPRRLDRNHPCMTCRRAPRPTSAYVRQLRPQDRLHQRRADPDPIPPASSMAISRRRAGSRDLPNQFAGTDGKRHASV